MFDIRNARTHTCKKNMFGIRNVSTHTHTHKKTANVQITTVQGSNHNTEL
jgi:hypothetical protein